MTDRPPIGSIVAYTDCENVSKDTSQIQYEPRVYPGRVVAYMPNDDRIVVEVTKLRTWERDAADENKCNHFYSLTKSQWACRKSTAPCGTEGSYRHWSPVDEAPANFGVVEFYE